MLSGEAKLYRRFTDGVLIEGGHFLTRKNSLLRLFAHRIIALDPRTPVFQCQPRTAIDPRTDRIRSTYLKLAEAHGGPVWERFSHLLPLQPKDFGPESYEELAQRIGLLGAMTNCPLAIPPYFAFSGPEDPWVSVNLDMFEAMKDVFNGEQVLLPIAFDSKLLADEKALLQVVDAFSTVKTNGFAVWPIGLDEIHASVRQLMGLHLLLTTLPSPSMLLYGGYFSIVLCALTASSFSNGPCFYEKRGLDLTPPLEFRPKCRYYLIQFRRRVDPVIAVVFYRILSSLEMKPTLCSACRRNVDGAGLDNLATMPDLDIFEHNLALRRREIEDLRSARSPLEETLGTLQWLLSNKRILSRFRPLSYARRWIEALELIRDHETLASMPASSNN